MKLYRFEAEDGLGPFRSLFSGRVREDLGLKLRTMPGPGNDSVLRDIDRRSEIHHTFFAFSSLDQLLRYMTVDNACELIHSGFKLYEFEADDYVEGETQAIFYRKTAVKVRSLNRQDLEAARSCACDRRSPVVSSPRSIELLQFEGSFD